MVIQWEGNEDLSYDSGEDRLEMDSRAILEVILTVEDERQMLLRMMLKPTLSSI